MIEDARHLAHLDGLQREIFDLLSHYNARANGKIGREELYKMRLDQLESLEGLIKAQRRAIRHALGLPIEPVAHEGNAVLIGKGGGSAA